MGMGKGLTWNNKTEGVNGAGANPVVSTGTAGAMLKQEGQVRPRKLRSTKALAGRTYKFQSLDSGESGQGEGKIASFKSKPAKRF